MPNLTVLRLIVALLVLSAFLAFVLNACGKKEEGPPPPVQIQEPESLPTPAYLQGQEEAPVKVDLNLLFLHHSCGSNWLAGDNGGLRQTLEKQGFQVHNATYGSKIGEHTDVIHWAPKFQEHMDLILKTKHQDQTLPEGKTNQVVLFKSCYPNSNIHAPGEKPKWDPQGLATVANYKLAYQALLPMFARHPDVLFVAVTAPPLLQRKTTPENAARAKEFNEWLVNEWPKAHKNVATFDFFGVLRTKEGYLNYPTRDSHPNKVGNRRATQEFLPFLYRALRRAAQI